MQFGAKSPPTRRISLQEGCQGSEDFGPCSRLIQASLAFNLTRATTPVQFPIRASEKLAARVSEG